MRGRRGVCRSLSALGAALRQFGDGYYYLASGAWPAESEKLDLNRAWVTFR